MAIQAAIPMVKLKMFMEVISLLLESTLKVIFKLLRNMAIELGDGLVLNNFMNSGRKYRKTLRQNVAFA